MKTGRTSNGTFETTAPGRRLGTDEPHDEGRRGRRAPAHALHPGDVQGPRHHDVDGSRQLQQLLLVGRRGWRLPVPGQLEQRQESRCPERGHLHPLQRPHGGPRRLRQGDPLVRPLLRDTGPRQEPRPGARLRPGREPLPGREPDGVPLRGHDGRRRGHHHRQYRQQGEHRPRNAVRLRHLTADGLEQHL